MFASATSGDKRNNAQFSNCSIANITLVLTEVCFKNKIHLRISKYKILYDWDETKSLIISGSATATS